MSMTLAPPLTAAEQQPDARHWTAKEFYRAAAEGQFADPDGLELVRGRLQRLMQGERHANLRFRVSRRLRQVIDPPLFTREENPLHLAYDLELIPDLLFTYEEEYLGRHPEPQDVALLVEVSDSSAEYDLGEKALLYAQAGIADYWVVLVKENAIVVHRKPLLEGYQDVVRLAETETLSPLVLPEAAWMVDALLGKEEAA